MAAASLIFLTPWGGLVALAVAVPLVAAAVASRRVRRTRTLLGLAAVQPVRRFPKILALAAVPLLLGLAATQPALRTTTSLRVRTDAQAFFVVDVSRSMKASKAPDSPTRLARALKAAVALRAAIPTVPSGIATLTDRVLPSLFPNADQAVFDTTMGHAVTIEQPPPENGNVVATSLAALGSLGTQNFFPPAVKRRLVVVLTDGESRPFDVQGVARALGTGPGVHVILVHVSGPDEAVYDGTRPEQGYREDPRSGAMLATLASALPGAAVVGEHALGRAARLERSALATGPTVNEGESFRLRPLAPYIVLIALLPLAAAFLRRPAAHRDRSRVGLQARLTSDRDQASLRLPAESGEYATPGLLP